MIAPLLPLQVSGYLWYQGESNSGQPESYAKCFPAMISQWRKSWGGAPNATFIFVQLAPWPDFDVGLITGSPLENSIALPLLKASAAMRLGLINIDRFILANVKWIQRPLQHYRLTCLHSRHLSLLWSQGTSTIPTRTPVNVAKFT